MNNNLPMDDKAVYSEPASRNPFHVEQTKMQDISDRAVQHDLQHGVVPALSQTLEQLSIPACGSGTFNVNLTYAPHNNFQVTHNEAHNYDIKGSSGFQINQVVNEHKELHHAHTPDQVNEQMESYPVLQSQESTSTDHTQEAIVKFKRALENASEPDLVLSKLDVSSNQIPEVHPEMFCVEFYEGRAVPEDENYHPRPDRQIAISSDRKLFFEELVARSNKHNFISIIGYPGSGKTTLSKRLIRRFSKIVDSVAFRLKFMDMNDFEDAEISLKELLLGDDNLDLEESDKTLVFNYIRQHPEKCYIVIDGFDQVQWNIKERLFPAKHDTPLSVQNLVSNLCKGKLLNKCHLIFTSRPHAVLGIPKRCRPRSTYFIRDLSFTDMKRLFDALIGDERKAADLWEALTTKAPQLESMCHNPLMLQLYIRAALSSKDIGYITSMTRVFHTVLQSLIASNHTVALNDAIVLSLARLAYKATKSGTVLIAAEDLDSEGLLPEEVQDLVITLLGSNQKCGLVEGRKRLYFTHQTFQEYFAAFYVSNEMPVEDFKAFLQRDMLTDHWSVVSQFLSGLLVDPEMRNVAEKEKRNLFIEKLAEEVAKKPGTFEAMDARLRKLRICKMLREGNDRKVTTAIFRSFSGRSINMTGISLTQSDAHALACVIKLIPTRMEDLALSNCHLNSGSFRHISLAIQQMPGSIEKLNITHNRLGDVHAISFLLPKIGKILYMWECFESTYRDRRDASGREIRILQDALESLRNKDLTICISDDECLRYKK